MSFLVVIAAYVLAHGITAVVVTPVQAFFLPEHTMFASLLYLPHGVRLLATWAFGWRAIPALFTGIYLAVSLFSPSNNLGLLDPAVVTGITVGALAGFCAFELVRLMGYDCYFGSAGNLNWKAMIGIGALASVFNSAGQTFAFSGFIGMGKAPALIAIYILGDVMGLIVCMLSLMLCFRWFRGQSLTKQPKQT